MSYNVVVNTSNITTSKWNNMYLWIKILGILFVVIGHSEYLTIETKLGGVNYILQSNISDIYYSSIFIFCKCMTEWVSIFHMPLFFLLSGAILRLKPIHSLKRLVLKKYQKLLLPYLFLYLFLSW